MRIEHVARNGMKSMARLESAPCECIYPVKMINLTQKNKLTGHGVADTQQPCSNMHAEVKPKRQSLLLISQTNVQIYANFRVQFEVREPWIGNMSTEIWSKAFNVVQTLSSICPMCNGRLPNRIINTTIGVQTHLHNCYVLYNISVVGGTFKAEYKKKCVHSNHCENKSSRKKILSQHMTSS